MEYVIALTGGSGISYGLNILRNLPGHRVLLISNGALEVAKQELRKELRFEDLKKEADEIYKEDEIQAPQSSGSHKFDAYIIAPASMNTIAKIANGISDNLITRVASVALKERRKFIVLFREMPLSTISLRNLLTLSENGVTIMPAAPGFYHNPKSIEDLYDFVTSRVLDTLGIDNHLIKRWGESLKS